MPNFSKHKSRISNLLTVTGTRCRIFPIDSDTVKVETLVPWMNDKSILIDKYDARCWLTEIGSERQTLDKSTENASIEALCDEERYMDLLNLAEESKVVINAPACIADISAGQSSIELENDDLIEKHKLNHNGEYSAVNFTYDEVKHDEKQECVEDLVQKEIEEDIPYQCPSDLIIPENIVLPETEKQAAKIEKTATFIANNGTQMEILVKTKQSKNDQFQFLNYDDKLNPFYKFLLEKIKSAEYVPARRHLCHLTKRETSESSIQDSTKLLPKIDITNTAYYKLINKYRSDNANVTEESQQHDTTHNNGDGMKTEESPTINPKPNDEKDANNEEDEKLYTQFYEQYYTYYYNYYYQLHTSTELSQDSNHIRIEEESKSMAINAAVYAAKAAIEQYQKEKEEKKRIEEEKVAKATKKKEHCMIIRYVHYLVKYGEEFEYSMMKNGEKLKFLDSDNPNHGFYQQCLRRAKKAAAIDNNEEKVEEVLVSVKFPKWEDYIKSHTGGIKSGPKLVTENHKSCIAMSEEEQSLVEVVEMISSLLSAEKIGRELSTPKVVDVKATRKRKATEFMEKLKQKAAKLSESDTEERHRTSKKSSSKKRKHKRR